MVTHQPSTAAEPATAALFPRTYIGGHEVRWTFADGGHIRFPEFCCLAGPAAECLPGCEHRECCEALSWLEAVDVAYGGPRERPFFDGEITIDITSPDYATWVHSSDWVCQDCHTPMSLSDPLRCLLCWWQYEVRPLRSGDDHSTGAWS